MGHRERIVHGYVGGFSRFDGAVERTAHDASRGLARSVFPRFENSDVFFTKQYFASDVQAHHSETDARVEHNSRGFRIRVDIEFRRRCDVAARERATHQHDAANYRG